MSASLLTMKAGETEVVEPIRSNGEPGFTVARVDSGPGYPPAQSDSLDHRENRINGAGT